MGAKFNPEELEKITDEIYSSGDSNVSAAADKLWSYIDYLEDENKTLKDIVDNQVRSGFMEELKKNIDEKIKRQIREESLIEAHIEVDNTATEVCKNGFLRKLILHYAEGVSEDELIKMLNKIKDMTSYNKKLELREDDKLFGREFYERVDEIAEQRIRDAVYKGLFGEKKHQMIKPWNE